MICKCGQECELCASNWPWNPDFWICGSCDSTYCFEEDKDDKREESVAKEAMQAMQTDIPAIYLQSKSLSGSLHGEDKEEHRRN